MRPVRIRGTTRNICGRIYRNSSWHGGWCCYDEQLTNLVEVYIFVFFLSD